jgi:hypothetical protein
MDRWNTLPWKSIQRNVFKLQTRMYRAACRDDVKNNCYIDIVTIRKQPGRLVAQVRMTRATLLRSRMNGNVHVRFCSRVGMATSRLRQRPEGEGRATVHRYPAHAQAVHGECTVELAKWTLPIISLCREPYEAKVSRTGLPGGLGRRAVR